MERDKLNSLMDDVLPLCDDLNGSENHLYDWMEAGNKDSIFDSMTASQIAAMWNREMAAYRRSEAARSLGSIRSERKAASSRENGKKGGRPRKQTK